MFGKQSKLIFVLKDEKSVFPPATCRQVAGVTATCSCRKISLAVRTVSLARSCCSETIMTAGIVFNSAGESFKCHWCNDWGGCVNEIVRRVYSASPLKQCTCIRNISVCGIVRAENAIPHRIGQLFDSFHEHLEKV